MSFFIKFPNTIRGKDPYHQVRDLYISVHGDDVVLAAEYTYQVVEAYKHLNGYLAAELALQCVMDDPTPILISQFNLNEPYDSGRADYTANLIRIALTSLAEETILEKLN